MPKVGAAQGPITRRIPIAIGVTGVVAAFVLVAFAFGGSHGAPIGAYTTENTYSYVTEPGLHPPVIRTDIKTASSKLAPGYILTTNFYNLSHPPMTGQSGPLILDNSLQPVWFKPVPSRAWPATSASRSTTASRSWPGGRAWSRTPAPPSRAST